MKTVARLLRNTIVNFENWGGKVVVIGDTDYTIDEAIKYFCNPDIQETEFTYNLDFMDKSVLLVWE